MRYVRRPKARGWVEDETFSTDKPLLPHFEVDGSEDVDTGLIWSDGTPIYRTARPIGFGRDEEW
ncbi:hypothetical protein SAMN06295920_101679 [Rhizorhabdus histidinilytica]|uniref:Uncharacterized protein n=1 Tax=Rhizorhabdus histidinilytica TaxID=439228 RepID=A0A1T5A7K5_9SPHN|nr:hypothetical protein SAMN06295920_101679 [Rhizorhabdus histidinilytica]